MRICGTIFHNGAVYEFISLSGDFKWVYHKLLKYMKKWNELRGHIDVNDSWKYTITVNSTYIMVSRWSDSKTCIYSREVECIG